MVKIGLECHVQLQTKTKLFCGCPNKFTEEPNVYVCEQCLGFPGSKPRLNSKAVELGARIGIALNCKFPKEMFFSRKSYFYPDMAKNFQITQYEIPLAKGGHLEAGKKIRIRRVHMEEDPARIVHVGGLMHAEYTLLDYNRSGVPLCEIVTEPDFSSAREARIFLAELSSILEYLGVLDPSVEGSMRVDANISVAETRVEVKNISGFRDVEKALEYEIVRQNGVLRRGGKIDRETRAWDAVAGVTRSLRLKEEEEDYGYIFDGDLPKITLKNIAEIKARLPELAKDKIIRYQKDMKVAEDLAVAITSEPSLAAMFEQVAESMNTPQGVQLAARWFAGGIKKTLNYSSLRMKDTALKPGHIEKLLKLVEEQKLTEKAAELLFRDMVLKPQDPEEMMKARGVGRIYDEKELEPFVKEAMNENAQAILDYKTGKPEAFHFIVGQVMRKTKGRGDPDTIRKLLSKRLK